MLQKTQSRGDGDGTLHLCASSPDLPQEATQASATDAIGEESALKPVATLQRANSLSSSDRERRSGRRNDELRSVPLNSGSSDAVRARGTLSSVSEEGDQSFQCKYCY